MEKFCHVNAIKYWIFFFILQNGSENRNDGDKEAEGENKSSSEDEDDDDDEDESDQDGDDENDDDGGDGGDSPDLDHSKIKDCLQIIRDKEKELEELNKVITSNREAGYVRGAMLQYIYTFINFSKMAKTPTPKIVIRKMNCWMILQQQSMSFQTWNL